MLLLAFLLRRRRRGREGAIKEKPKRVWVRETFRRRKEQGEFHRLVRADIPTLVLNVATGIFHGIYY